MWLQHLLNLAIRKRLWNLPWTKHRFNFHLLISSYLFNLFVFFVCMHLVVKINLWFHWFWISIILCNRNLLATETSSVHLLAIQTWWHRVWSNGILLLVSLIRHFARVWSVSTETLSILWAVSSSAASWDRSFLFGTFPWITVSTHWSCLFLGKIIAASTHAVRVGGSCVWASFLLRCKSLIFSALLVLFFNYGFLNLIIQKCKQILSIIWHKFLPNKETFSPIHSSLNVGIGNALLYIRINMGCISIQNAIKGVDTYQD